MKWIRMGLNRDEVALLAAEFAQRLKGGLTPSEAWDACKMARSMIDPDSLDQGFKTWVFQSAGLGRAEVPPSPPPPPAAEEEPRPPPSPPLPKKKIKRKKGDA
jgi:hypothetical protein